MLLLPPFSILLKVKRSEKLEKVHQGRKKKLSVSEDFTCFDCSHSKKVYFTLIYKDTQNGNKSLYETVITLICITHFSVSYSADFLSSLHSVVHLMVVDTKIQYKEQGESENWSVFSIMGNIS